MELFSELLAKIGLQDVFLNLPVPATIVIIGVVVGVFFSVIKKLAKITILVLIVGILLLIALKLIIEIFGLSNI
jgi:hypothetical protein